MSISVSMKNTVGYFCWDFNSIFIWNESLFLYTDYFKLSMQCLELLSESFRISNLHMISCFSLHGWIMVWYFLVCWEHNKAPSPTSSCRFSKSDFESVFKKLAEKCTTPFVMFDDLNCQYFIHSFSVRFFEESRDCFFIHIIYLIFYKTTRIYFLLVILWHFLKDR